MELKVMIDKPILSNCNNNCSQAQISPGIQPQQTAQQAQLLLANLGGVSQANLQPTQPLIQLPLIQVEKKQDTPKLFASLVETKTSTQPKIVTNQDPVPVIKEGNS